MEESVWIRIRMSASSYLEELLYMFLKATLTNAEKKALTNGWDVEEHIDEETEYELKEQIYASVKSYVRWSSIIRRLQDELDEEDEEEEEEDEQEDSEDED